MGCQNGALSAVADGKGAAADDKGVLSPSTFGFDPRKVTTKDGGNGESDEGTSYSTSTTAVYHDGERFYGMCSSSTANIGGARGEDHEAKLADGGRTLVIRFFKLSGRDRTFQKEMKIDLAAEWARHARSKEQSGV